MKALVVSLLTRNAVAAAFLMLLSIGIRMLPRENMPPWMLVPLAFFGSLLWANSLLIKRGHPIIAGILALILVPVLGFPIGICSFQFGRYRVERQYQAQGLQLVEGCNAAAANSAKFDIYSLNDRLAELTNSVPVNTNQVIQLQNACIVAQERVQILNEDCRRRGHRDSHPWKTNWVTIKQVLAASE